MNIALFRAVNQPTPVVRDLPWQRVVQMLTRIRPIEGDKEYRERHCPLWAPVEMVEGGRRRAADVVSVQALVLDYDDGVSIHEALDRWHGYERVAHTSWSNQTDDPRCRVVIPLATPVPAAAWSDVYAWVLERDGQTADPHCKDPSRQFYLPAVGAGGPQIARHIAGQWMDLGGVAEETQRLADQQRQEQRQRAEEARRSVRRAVKTAEERDREARRALEVDWVARRAFGEAMGGRVIERPSGSVVKGVPCPACGRSSVWWVIDPLRWRGCGCEHNNSCGWTGRLYDLVAA